jgi:hypothetical protein
MAPVEARKVARKAETHVCCPTKSTRCDLVPELEAVMASGLPAF